MLQSTLIIVIQFLDDVNNFNEIMAAVQLNYVGNLPRHVSEPESSAFAIMTDEEFKRLSDEEALTIFSEKHIITTNELVQEAKWDEDTLQKLAHLNMPVYVHGKVSDIVNTFMRS